MATPVFQFRVYGFGNVIITMRRADFMVTKRPRVSALFGGGFELWSCVSFIREPSFYNIRKAFAVHMF